MSRPGSVLLQTGALSLMAVAVAVAICFAVVLGLPMPAPAMTSIGEIAAVMGHPDRGRARGFRWELHESVPDGPQSPLVARGLADALHVPADSVRAVWQSDTPVSPARAATGQALLTIAGQDVVVDARADGFNLRSGEGARLDANTRVPVFQAAMRQPDGNWLVVTPPDAALTAWRQRVFVAFLLSGFVVAPVAWWLARKLTRPMRRLADAANRMQLDMSTHLPTSDGPREVREVAAAMEAMRARVAAQAVERTRMLVAVAHDLRNPLTGLRVRVESASPDLRDRMVADIDRMAGMISQVLSYARGFQAPTPGERVDLVSLLEECVQDARVRRGNVTWTRPDDAIRVVADPGGLRRAIDNVIENAVRYGTSADVSIDTRNAAVLVRIHDEGPGIHAADLGRLMQPFERGESSRNQHTGGLGLGLTITGEIVARHGGSLRLKNGATRGLEVEIELPLA